MRAFIALGSNLDGPVERIEEAIRRLDQPQIRVQSRGRLVASPPVGPQDQPDFVNTVIEVQTELSGPDLLARCQAVELAMGRTKLRHWGERVIDLDVVAMEDRVIDSPSLKLPHPEASRRSFVLVPLADLWPDGSLPGVPGRIADLAAVCNEPPLHVLDPRVRTRQELCL